MDRYDIYEKFKETVETHINDLLDELNNELDSANDDYKYNEGMIQGLKISKNILLEITTLSN